MSEGFDTLRLNALARDLLRSGEAYRKQEKKFLQKEGTKLRQITAREARKVPKKTGNYRKSIKRGKVYRYRGSQAVRVYSAAPHAHLIENGHRMVTHDGREVGFVPGHHVFERGRRQFESQFYEDLDQFLTGELRL